ARAVRVVVQGESLRAIPVSTPPGTPGRVTVRRTGLPGLLVIEPRVFSDSRGFFFETYNTARYAQAGLPERFVQDNHSASIRGTVRGLHYQLHRPQAKLLRVIGGEIFDVAVDIRRGSPTFGRWEHVILLAENKRQFFVPAGFAHGFCVVSDVAAVESKCTGYYLADAQRGVLGRHASL